MLMHGHGHRTSDQPGRPADILTDPVRDGCNRERQTVILKVFGDWPCCLMALRESALREARKLSL